MNVVGPVSRVNIVLWAILWLFVIAIAAGSLGLNGWPWRISSLQNVMYASNGWLHSAFVIEKLKNKQSEGEKFVYIGGSACMEGITSDRDISSRITETIQRIAEFHSICSSYTTLTDIAKIVDRLGNIDGLLLIMLEPATLGKGIEIQNTHIERKSGKTLPKYYYLTTPPAIRKIQNKYGCERDCGSDFLQYLKYAPAQFLIAFRGGIPRFLTGDDKRYKRHHLRKTVANETIMKNAGKYIDLMKNNKKTVSMNKELLENIIEIARNNNNKVALVNIPIVDEYAYLISEQVKAYDSYIDDLVNKYNVHHFDFRKPGSWPQQDFYDTHHMSLSGRTRYTQLLADRLSAFTQANQ